VIIGASCSRAGANPLGRPLGPGTLHAGSQVRSLAGTSPGSSCDSPEIGSHDATEDQAGDLLLHLATLLSNAPAEVLTGDRVVEIRPQGVNKGQVVPAVMAHAPPGSLVTALGDDRTDEDLFAALPPGSISVHVGPAPSRTELRVRSVAEARAFLRGLVAQDGGAVRVG